MYSGITTAYLPALRYSHIAYGYLEAWRGGSRLTFADGTLPDGTGDPTRLPLREDGTNQVVVDGATPGARRTLTATLTPLPGLWELLAPTGTELRAYTVLRYLSGDTETVPQGVFPIDVQKMGYGQGGDLQLTAPDRWSVIQRARFLTPRAADAGNSVRQQIADLLTEAIPGGAAVTDTGTASDTVPVQTWDRDRAQAIEDLAKAASLDVYFSRTGQPVIRDVPTLDRSALTWIVDASDTGVLIDASRERNRQKTFNLVVINGTRNDGTVPFPTQFVWDNDPTSDTYCGPGPGFGPTPPDAGDAGPFGQRPTYYSSPLLADASQAVAAGLTILARVRGLAAQLTATAIPNPALDDGDTILVQLPPARRDLPRPAELHIVDGFTVPLVPSKAAMTITTRSTRPDDVQDT